MRAWASWKPVAAAALGVCLTLAWRAYQDSGPPVIIQSFETVDDTVAAGIDGDTISFVVGFDRLRSCPTTISRFIWHWVDYRGQRIRDFHSIDNPPLSPMPGQGEQKYMITLRVQGNLPSGPWYERTVTLPQCNLFGWTTRASNTPRIEDHPIKVERPKL